MPVTLTGTGNQATSKFSLTAGLHILTAIYPDDSFFIVELLDGTTGERVDLLINEFSGTSPTSTAFSVEAEGVFLLNVSNASGEWTITIE